jgi:hypothetical protein
VKIAVLTDVHANLPALEAALEAIRRESCDTIYQWPYVIRQVFEGVCLTFTHYGLQKGWQQGRCEFAPIIGDPTPKLSPSCLAKG